MIIIQALVSLGVAVLTLIGGYLIYGPKLRKEQKSDFQKDIGKKKADALIQFKELIHICDTIDIYDVENETSDSVAIKITEIDSAIYPGFMEDEKTLNDFMEKVSSLRSVEMYLDNEAAAYLLYLYKYMFELVNFISVYAPNVRLDTLGTLFIFDFQNWSKHADQIVIRDINAANVEIQSHKDQKWEAVKNSVYNLLYEDSVLHILQKESADNPQEEMLLNCFNDIVSSEPIEKA